MYSRQIILDEIGVKGQEKIKNAKVLITGIGGLGSPIAQTLCASGVGNICLMDGDIVEFSNLSRQPLYSPNDIGQKKTIVSSKKLKENFPSTDITYIDEFLTKENAIDIIRKYDIIVDGSDNFSTKYLINDAALICNKPWVYASILQYNAQISVFNYKNGPTYRCLFDTSPANSQNCAEAGVISTLPPLAASFQANEVLKIILNIGDTLSGVLLEINSLNNKIVKFNFKRNPNLKTPTKLKENYKPINCNNAMEIKWEEIKERLNEYQILDVRNQNEWDNHNIGGILLPLPQIENNPKYLPEVKTSKVLVMCARGVRSMRAAQILQPNYPDLEFFSLKNGIPNKL